MKTQTAKPSVSNIQPKNDHFLIQNYNELHCFLVFEHFFSSKTHKNILIARSFLNFVLIHAL